MGMMNSNSMIGYTYLNQNYQNYHSQPPTGYNSYIGNTPTNKFTSNQFYGTNQNQVQPQIYNNIYQNKMSNQMHINQANQSVPLSNAPIMNSLVNQNIPAAVQTNPSIPNIAQNSSQVQKESSITNNSATSSSTIKKPINLDAQSFIPKNLKKQSISSEKEALSQTPKKEIAEPQVEPAAISESNENQNKLSSPTESIKSEYVSLSEKVLTPSTESNDKTPKQKELSDSGFKHSPDNFALDRKEHTVASEEKPQSSSANSEAVKSKPKSLLGSILNQAPQNSTASKQPEKTIVNVTAAPFKKKSNDATKALEEKAKLLKEQEKQKKEEKLREEIKQKQAATVSNASSTKKADKSSKIVSKSEEAKEAEKAQNIEEENVNVYKDEEGPVSIEKKFTIERIYFKVYENQNREDNKNRFSFDYLFSFRNWNICAETKLIEDLEKGHFRDLRETVEEFSTQKSQGRGGNENKGGFGKRGTKFRDEPVQPKISNENMTFQRSKIELKTPETKETLSTETGEGLGKWGRKDLSKEEKLASEFKERRQVEVGKDPIRFKLTEYNLYFNLLFVNFRFLLNY